MSKLVITGGNRLSGEIDVGGAKNSVLPILAATLLINGTSVIHNCPYLSDVEVAIKILTSLGCRCKREGHTVTVDARDVVCDTIPEDLMREMRSSVMFLGAILSRCKSAVISSPGGCELGPRPIDLHLKALRDLGYSVDDKNGYIICKSDKSFNEGAVSLSFPSVGATENSILAAVFKRGKTVITGAAKEPEISDLADFLNGAGARIYGAGTERIEIFGVNELHDSEHAVISDRIVTATFISAAAITGGEVKLNKTEPSHLDAVLSSFTEAGCKIISEKNSLFVSAPPRLRAVHLTKTLVYPGFPTDAGPLLAAALTKSEGCSVFVETIFENRFRYMDELVRLGANIRIHNKVAVIEGVSSLKGARVKATDLRGGAALITAGLAAEGETEIDDIFHIERGYEEIDEKLTKLGAIIRKE